jgi:hypothetical protein
MTTEGSAGVGMEAGSGRETLSGFSLTVMCDVPEEMAGHLERRATTPLKVGRLKQETSMCCKHEG